MKTLIVIVLILCAWVTVTEAQMRCTYRCSGRVCWVDCS